MITRGFVNNTLMTRGMGMFNGIREILHFVSRITTKVFFRDNK